MVNETSSFFRPHADNYCKEKLGFYNKPKRDLQESTPPHNAQKRKNILENIQISRSKTKLPNTRVAKNSDQRDALHSIDPPNPLIQEFSQKVKELVIEHDKNKWK